MYIVWLQERILFPCKCIYLLYSLIAFSHNEPIWPFQGATIVDQSVHIALAPDYELPAAAASALATVILSPKSIS